MRAAWGKWKAKSAAERRAWGYCAVAAVALLVSLVALADSLSQTVRTFGLATIVGGAGIAVATLGIIGAVINLMEAERDTE